MKTVTYTGTNYDEVKRLCGDKVLAPFREDDGSLRVEK